MLAGGTLLDDATQIECPDRGACRCEGPHHAAGQRHRVFDALRPSARQAFEEIAGAGHAICQEQPAEVARAIAAIVGQQGERPCLTKPSGSPPPRERRLYRAAGAACGAAHPPRRRGQPGAQHERDRQDAEDQPHHAAAPPPYARGRRFVERRPDGAGFQVGLSLLEVGARALFSQDLVQVAVPVLTRLAETLQLSAHLGVLDRTDVLYLVRRTPNTPLASNIRVGSRLPAHATTMGRMLLAFMPAVEIDKLYAGKELKRFSEHTSTTLAALHAKAEKDRSAGIAWSDAHFESGISSAAVPVFDFAGPPVGAINVSGPVDLRSPTRRGAAVIGAELAVSRREISRRLGWIGGDAARAAGPRRWSTPRMNGRVARVVRRE